MLDSIEKAFHAGAITALRKAGARQRDAASGGTATAGEKFPGVVIRSPEAACAVNLANDWDEVAQILVMEERE